MSPGMPKGWIASIYLAEVA